MTLKMSATVDSGNETLFSDGSSCDLVSSPAVLRLAPDPQLTPDPDLEPDPDLQSVDSCRDRDRTSELNIEDGRRRSRSSMEHEFIDERGEDNKNVPPKIQPYSGVLEKGKIVIRPIAFKPIGMTQSSRFGVSGERYGSTPILTRPGSHLVHYGSSNDLRHQHHRHHYHAANSNYSLDRKLLSSASSSPPLAMVSLTSLPHKLVNYDSMESVRKSPGSTVDSNTNKSSSYRLSGPGGGSLLDLTPSPSDSGVSELEAALRDRDSELAYLRQTMEHNEQVIFRVYQEKEKVWERELRRLKGVHEGRLRASAQKALRLEQMLMMQTYQLQQDKKRLSAEAQRSSCQADRLREEVATLRTRLEDTEWNLCQKTGEMALLKTQLKDAQNEQTNKGHELLALRSKLNEAHNSLELREQETQTLRRISDEREQELERLRAEVRNLREAAASDQKRRDKENVENERLKGELKELRQELSEVAMSGYEGAEPGRLIRASRRNIIDSQPLSLDSISSSCDLEISHQQLNNQHQQLQSINSNSDHHCPESERLLQELSTRRKSFEQERVTWAQEKEKVLRYQRQLQLNYVQMFRRTRALEAEVESLSLELELNSKGTMKIKKGLCGDLGQTVEL